MARKDTINKYGRENLNEVFDMMEKEHPFLEKYEKEFQENGIKNLKVIRDNKKG